MSVKVCFRILPLAINCFKGNRHLLFRPEGNIFSRVQCTSFNFTNKINTIRFCSSNSNRENQEKGLKQVYYGVLTPQIRAVKWFSLSSSMVGIIAQPFLYKEIAATGNIPIIVAAYSFIGFFTLVTPLLLHFITKKYITHLEYKEPTGSYIAKTVNFFCITKETEFKPEDVKVPEVPGMFTTFIVNGKSLFLDPRQFEQPEHYAKIMGYDKPLDFKLYDNPPPNESKKD